MDLEFSPKQVFRVLIVLIALLFTANAAGLIAKHLFDLGGLYGVVDLVDFNKEKNIPTLFSSMQLIIAGALLAGIGVSQKFAGKSYIAWIFLSLIFFFLAVDETAQIHERFADPIRETWDPKGALYFAWVIPYGIAVLVFVLGMSRFLIRLPGQTRARFVSAGAIYVSGAIGFEMLSARQYYYFGPNNFTYAALYTCEETLELLGIAFFIFALLDFWSRQHSHVRLTLKN